VEGSVDYCLMRGHSTQNTDAGRTERQVSTMMSGNLFANI
jgi:hypothetical protein